MWIPFSFMFISVNCACGDNNEKIAKYGLASRRRLICDIKMKNLS
jgi:hypothetical protein